MVFTRERLNSYKIRQKNLIIFVYISEFGLGSDRHKQEMKLTLMRKPEFMDLYNAVKS